MEAGNFPGWARRFMSRTDLDHVSQAVRRAEEKTRGEIVPVVVKASTPLSGVFVATTLFCVALFGFIDLHYFPHEEPYSFIIAMALAVLFGFGLAQISAIQRFALPEKDENKAVHERAELEFYREGVHKTDERIGILIFVSVLERKVVILADQGIAEKLSADVWTQTVQKLLISLKKGHVAEGMTRAIEECGELLAQKFPRLPNDRNELRNDLVLKD